MSWTQGKLGDILVVKRGQNITKKEAKEGIYPVILGGREPAYFIDKFNHIGKAIVVSRSGASAGYISFWNEPIFVTDGFLIEPKDDVSYEYLYYLMKYKQGEFHNAQRGAAIPHVTPALITGISVDIAPKKIQDHIADILSAYDNLIENNQKQIKLLEEAAQRLYKEWFIDLRFPGHETTKIVDGIPTGWHYGSITEISTCYDSKRKPLSSKERDNQEKIYPYYGAASLMDYVEKFIFDGVYLLFGEDGTVITSDETPMLQYVWGKFWVNNHAHIFQGANGYSTEFLYMLCKHMKIKDVVTGVAQPKISQGRLNDKKIVIPSQIMAAKYSELTLAIFEKIRLLNDSVNAAKEARDRLLPKLMSGEIEV